MGVRNDNGGRSQWRTQAKRMTFYANTKNPVLSYGNIVLVLPDACYVNVIAT